MADGALAHAVGQVLPDSGRQLVPTLDLRH